MTAPEPGSPAAELTALDEELVARFSDALARIWPEAGRGSDARLGLAVSGGPDSTALLLLAAAALPGRVEAATADHRLRPENADEAVQVARLCDRLGLPHRTLAVTVEPGNLQAEARAARYAAMGGWMVERGLSALATAHHADDQAETVMLRLNRASGVAGLAGARARGRVPGTDLLLLRPLLDWRRETLVKVVTDAGVTAAQDPSNADDRFDRARIRKALMASDWLDIAAIAESAAHLADADAALDWAARREWAEGVRKQGLGLTYRPRAPRAIALRVLTRIVVELDGTEPRGSAVARLFDALCARSPASIGGLTARPGVEAGFEEWSFARAPQRRVK
ncbi:MAG TPA: tRNA lysidine(34) synthetase TilS [Novosphingobium sp.]|nr:tRNA lysidine(34) synthetase TilS [Novosphingobium sp.]